MNPNELSKLYEDHHATLRALLDDGLEKMHPTALIKQRVSLHENKLRVGDTNITLSEDQPIYVIGAGKASGEMAVGLESVLGNRITEGIVIVPESDTAVTERVRCLPGNHPLPDEASLTSTKQILSFCSTIPKNAIVFNLFSGGASALLCSPPKGVSLASMQRLYTLLLESGAAIDEMNTVRKHLSSIKGGRLLHHLQGTHLIDLLISDVPGDTISFIGSGPTTCDSTSISDAMDVLSRYNLRPAIPIDLQFYLEKKAHKRTFRVPEQNKFTQSHHQLIVGSSRVLTQIIAKKASSLGYNVVFSEKSYQGETRSIAIEQARIVMEHLKERTSKTPPTLFLFHGESYVVVKGTGKGGRNQELALTAALSIEGQHGISLLSAGTDGRDGPTDAAGAIVNANSTLRARRLGLDPDVFLRNNDSYSYFSQTNELVRFDQKGNNLMDIQLWMVTT